MDWFIAAYQRCFALLVFMTYRNIHVCWSVCPHSHSLPRFTGKWTKMTDEVWTLVKKPSTRNGEVSCPFDRTDKGYACNAVIRCHTTYCNYSPVDIKRHLNSKHKEWRCHLRQRETMVKYTTPGKRMRETDAPLQEVFLKVKFTKIAEVLFDILNIANFQLHNFWK